MSKKPKAHKTKELEDGTWEYSDGSIRNSKGHWVKRPPASFGSADLITSENAHSMIARKVENRAAEIVQALSRDRHRQLAVLLDMVFIGHIRAAEKGRLIDEPIGTNPCDP